MTARRDQLLALLASQADRRRQLRAHHHTTVKDLAAGVAALHLTVDAIQNMLAGATRMLASAKDAAEAARTAGTIAQAMVLLLDTQRDLSTAVDESDAQLEGAVVEAPASHRGI